MLPKLNEWISERRADITFLVSNSHQKVAYVTRKQAASRGEPPLSIFSPRI
jgi:hypothetical protein